MDGYKQIVNKPEMGGSVSSATIRNELSDLTEMGYLEQPHTSAGRMPAKLTAWDSSRKSWGLT